ncbi:sensor histidine kinase [Cryobacterium melibiosiphilum]|uniref:sensor histidine kinase n=1 Tax=Cryobacterium melibiosiphilum TaxID=995039 RepID=UPI0011C2408F|nr:HAMP domain-containing sensor histidine kinase [Cryobacterium melibiosiphilum]
MTAPTAMTPATPTPATPTAAAAAQSARPGWSVRVRILAAILLVAAVGLTVAGGTAYLVQRDRALQEVDARLSASVESVRFIVTGSPTTDLDAADASALPEASSVTYASTRDALQAVMARLVPSSNESSLGLINGVPALIPGTELAFHLEDDQEFVLRVIAEVDGGNVVRGTAVGELGNLRYIAAPVTVEGSGEAGIFVTAFDLDAELGELTSAFRIYTAVAAAALVAIGLVGWFVAGRLLRPIRQLRAAASRITASDLHERIPVVGRDDVSELTRTVNDMLERLDESLTAQRQLLNDVRHELKTPITIVRGYLELLDPHNADDVAAARAIALDELDRMTGLIDDIESLANAQRADLVRVPTDAADLTVQVFQKISAIPDHAWILVEQAHVVVPVDPARLTQALLQLANNAAKHSADGTPIEIGSTEHPDAVEFWIADHGPGIPAEAKSRIFERFGRIDTGRGVEGSGLGLPIVDAIARAHGGYINLTTSPAGSRFGILVPRRTVDIVPGTASAGRDSSPTDPDRSAP